MIRAIVPRRLAAAVAGLVALCILDVAPAGAVEIQRVVSPMGIEAWLVESDAVPVIAMEFAFLGGSASDPVGKEGLANLVSTLLDEGAGELDSATFQQRLADAAINLNFDAGTDAFYGSLKTVTDQSGEAFDLLALALNEPRFDDEAIGRMRAAVLASIRRQLGDPGWLARRVFFEAVFPGHPYARPSRGTVATVEGLTADDLRGFVADRFARDNLRIGVTGDISAAELAPVLDRVFGGLPEHAAPLDVPEVEPSAAGERLLVEWAGTQSTVLMGQRGVERHDPDYYAATVMNYILGGGGFGSRLTAEVRENRGLTYGVGSYLAIYDNAELLMASSSMSNQNVVPAIDLIIEEWRRMAEEGVTEEELADAKTYLTGSFPLNLTSTDRIANILLGMQIDELGIDYLDRRNAEIEAVTLEDVNRVAAELLEPDALTIVVVGAPGEGYGATRVIDAAEIVRQHLAPAG